VEAVDQATRRLIFEVALSEAHGNFTLGKSELPPEAKAEIDKVVGQMKADPRPISSRLKDTPTRPDPRRTIANSFSSAPKP